ncbi:MAG: Lysine exporter protein, partial [Massilibacillus sp.]|nr:Lysine exporter protein [Massilibacillus sp.]
CFYNRENREDGSFMTAFLHGLCLAIGLILPLGIQNLFIFQQGVLQPRFYLVLPAVITASLCDTVLILCAVSGVSLLLFKFMMMKVIMIGGGVIILFYMGYLTWHSRVDSSSVNAMQALSRKKQIMFAMSVSFLNPSAVLDIIGVIGTSSAQYANQEKMFFMLACISVSWLWFFCLAIVGRFLGEYKDIDRLMFVINKVSAVFIWSTAIYLMFSLKEVF